MKCLLWVFLLETTLDPIKLYTNNYHTFLHQFLRTLTLPSIFGDQKLAPRSGLNDRTTFQTQQETCGGTISTPMGVQGQPGSRRALFAAAVVINHRSNNKHQSSQTRLRAQHPRLSPHLFQDQPPIYLGITRPGGWPPLKTAKKRPFPSILLPFNRRPLYTCNFNYDTRENF